jgi:N-acetyl-gamma-glutamyl-phosphate reductase
MHKIFIDGQSGTTGLQIHERLQRRSDICLLEIAEEDRKKPTVKRELINEAALVILCLPDDAAKQTVLLGADSNARMLDASTAHRTDPDWVYGLPELDTLQREKISNAKYVSNPGCYPTGFLLAIAPLVKSGLLASDAQLSISAVSGYSGGGHKMIDRYETRQKAQPDAPWSSRPYSLKFGHKHVTEMQHFAALTRAPLFMPSVGHYRQGMLVSTPLAKEYFTKATSLDLIYECLQDRYENEPCIHVHKPNSEQALVDGFLDPQGNNESNRNDIYIFGNSDQMLLVSQLDNLGKGAAGAAIQNLNLMLGISELSGLNV